MGKKRGKQAQSKQMVKTESDQQLMSKYNGFVFEDEAADYTFYGDIDHMELAEALKEIKREEAANFVEVAAKYLDTFKDSHSLLECFSWVDARQGYAFWEECYHELVTSGYQDPIDVEFSFWGLTPKEIEKEKVKAA